MRPSIRTRRLRALGFETYDDYLASALWRQAKRRYWEDPASATTCHVCGTDEHLQLHHTTYQRLGEELPTDLMPLCFQCHGWVHALLAQGILKDLALRGLYSVERSIAYQKERREMLERAQITPGPRRVEPWSVDIDTVQYVALRKAQRRERAEVRKRAPKKRPSNKVAAVDAADVPLHLRTYEP